MKTPSMLIFPTLHTLGTEAPRSDKQPATADAPDPTYWTSYDHFMIEREARAQRREYTWSLIRNAFRWIKARVFGAALDTKARVQPQA